ncbi:MAG: tetratricopeptide repeat protein [Saprospiraceae bacterium]
MSENTSSDRLKQLYQFLKDRPDDEFLLFAVAKEYEKLGNEEKAKEYYLKLTTDHANYVGTYYHLGKLYERDEDFDLATETYEKGMEVAKAVGDKHAFGELRGAHEMIDF